MKFFFDKRSYLPGSPAARLHRHTMTPRFQVLDFSCYFLWSNWPNFVTICSRSKGFHITPCLGMNLHLHHRSALFLCFVCALSDLLVFCWIFCVSLSRRVSGVCMCQLYPLLSGWYRWWCPESTRAKTDPCETMIASNVKKSNLARGDVTLRERLPIGWLKTGNILFRFWNIFRQASRPLLKQNHINSPYSRNWRHDPPLSQNFGSDHYKQ